MILFSRGKSFYLCALVGGVVIRVKTETEIPLCPTDLCAKPCDNYVLTK